MIYLFKIVIWHGYIEYSWITLMASCVSPPSHPSRHNLTTGPPPKGCSNAPAWCDPWQLLATHFKENPWGAGSAGVGKVLWSISEGRGDPWGLRWKPQNRIWSSITVIGAKISKMKTSTESHDVSTSLVILGNRIWSIWGFDMAHFFKLISAKMINPQETIGTKTIS